MRRFATEWFLSDDNLVALSDLSGMWGDRVHGRRPPKVIALDTDSSASPAGGDQVSSAYNRHFGCNCYPPRGHSRARTCLGPWGSSNELAPFKLGAL
jgi:hypothetical protein